MAYIKVIEETQHVAYKGIDAWRLERQKALREGRKCGWSSGLVRVYKSWRQREAHESY